jgi:hypothetical protein
MKARWWQKIMHVAGLARNVRLLRYIPQRSLINSMDVGQVISIDILPDDVLLAIFDFWQVRGGVVKQVTEAWRTLVHVCRRWRGVVFGSPRRLDLHLVYQPGTPARDTLDVWPALLLEIQSGYPERSPAPAYYSADSIMDDIFAVLEHSARVYKIYLEKRLTSCLHMKKVVAAMQGPFPELTDLVLHWFETDTSGPVIPDSFLGGSAPRLRELRLFRFPFPGLPKLLLSAPHLVDLHLHHFSPSDCLSLEAMVTSLSTLTSLESLALEFGSPRPDPAGRRPPPSTRSVLPALTWLMFRGVSEYLEDLLVRIDVPQLSTLNTILFNQIDFYTPQLVRFISRTPNLNVLEIAELCFGVDTAWISLSSLAEHQAGHQSAVNVQISCQDLDWQVSSLEQLCTLFLPSTSAPEGLYIYYPWNDSGRPYRKDTGNVENALWLALLHPFTAAKNLYLSKEFTPCIAPALQELAGGRTTEFLPTLQNIFLEEVEPSGPAQEAIGTFVAARQLSGHPVSISRWERGSVDGAATSPSSS